MLHAACAGALGIRDTHDLLFFAVFGACSLGGFFASNQYAIQTGGAALASVLLYTAPAWVAVFSRIFFHDGVTPLKAVAIIVSLAGVASISLAGSGPAAAEGVEAAAHAGAGVFFGLLAGLLYATHYVFSKKYLSLYSACTLYGYCMLFGALSLFPFVTFSLKSGADWAVLFFLGLVSTYCAYLIYCEGLKRLDATRAAVLATLEPVVATLAAWRLWGEIFTAGGWIGAVLILSAVLILVLGPGEKRPFPKTAA